MFARIASLALLAILLTGCARDPNLGRMEKVKVGMTEAEVVSAIGEPDSKNELDDTVKADINWSYKSTKTDLWVQFFDGKVEETILVK